MLALLAGMVLTAPPAILAQTTTTVTTLHSFNGSGDGSSPGAPLVQGSDGNFYGTANSGGPGYLGTVFRLTPTGDFTLLHTFAPGVDGAGPRGALVQGKDGSFYGTTAGYFSIDLDEGDNGTTYGTVYKITTDGVFKTLHKFDGAGPDAALVQGADGNFYGVVASGTNFFGEVFKITPDGEYTTLHGFTDGEDGGNPMGGLVLASDGNFYGMTAGYSYHTDTVAQNYGTVFRVTPGGDFATVYHFTNGSDGSYPSISLTQGRDGRLYGIIYTGPKGGRQTTIFALTLDGTFTALHTLVRATEGGGANALFQASDGNFYGTTGYYGANDVGTVFRLTPDGVLTTLYNFAGNPDDPDNYVGEGDGPWAALIQGSDGNLYGTASTGGANSVGTVFRLTFGTAPSTFFTGEESVGENFYYLSFANGNYFGFYTFFSDPHYLFHLDLGYEYVVAANDASQGMYLYDFASGDFLYTSPTFPFPYLYDFGLNAFLYYFPNPDSAGHYNTNGVRYFYNFNTHTVITR